MALWSQAHMGQRLLVLTLSFGFCELTQPLPDGPVTEGKATTETLNGP